MYLWVYVLVLVMLLLVVYQWCEEGMMLKVVCILEMVRVITKEKMYISVYFRKYHKRKGGN